MKYTGDYTREIVFPLGGIGTGSIGLAGNGVLRDWEIFNRPAKGSYNGYTHFAVRAFEPDGRVIAKALCGDPTKDYMGQYQKRNFGGYGYGVEQTSMAGFPHFPDWSFEDRFPFAELTFSAPDFPARVSLTAFNPFIPMDEDNSGIPAAFFEIRFTNTSDHPICFGAACSLHRPFPGQNHAIRETAASGILMRSCADEASVDYRDLTVLCLSEQAQLQPCWYRGALQDAITTFWREFSEGSELRPRAYDGEAKKDTGSVYTQAEIPAGGSKSFRFLIAWNTPNTYNYWKSYREEEGMNTSWKNYYATLWQDSRASGLYAAGNWDMLERRSRAFSDAVYATTVDPVVIEAATANLCTLKSATVLRLEDGTLWGWEGLHEKEGSCEGTCTHVWNYAYAMPFLFPRLERSIREADYRYNALENGMMAFRTKLPIGRPDGKPLPCVDGQMGGIIKTYREWKLSGDTQWLRGLWPSVKAALEYAWVDDGVFSWDADKDGVLEGRQHHTLDMELFGPSAWLEGFYLAALKAAAEMAEALGYETDAAVYRDLFARGSAFVEKELFNGSYYVHKIDLTDKSLVERFGVADVYWNEEAGQIKYQIGEGSEIDQLCAQWHAVLCGLGDIFDPEHRRVALRSMYQNNFKPSMRNFANPWRVFVVNEEAGAIMCDYPEGTEKPIIPVPYCEECMSGFEYALGELMIAEGMMEEGMTLIRSIRERSDGKKRNPFNEIECGSNYARAMASWGLIPILSGFSYDMPAHRIGFAPRRDAGTFQSVWACGSAWGSVRMDAARCALTVSEGEIGLMAFAIAGADKAKRVLVDGREISFAAHDGALCFEAVHTVTKELTVMF
ncbi:MAG: hypothetical protein IJW44_02270 [Clostridia bacterium]|nr:hypothetical protein [Clostridia bacterium]